MFQLSTCKQEQGKIFIFPLLRLFVNRSRVLEALIQNSIKTILRFKTLMTNKTEHDGHGSKTVEISDMKYNIFKVRNLLYLFFILFIFSHTWKLRLSQGFRS